MASNPIEWEALEYEHIEKGTDWYWAVGIIALSITLISFILGNYTFAIVVIVSAFALIVGASRKPKVVRFEITKLGIHIGNEYIQYKDIKSFWVENNHHHDGVSKLFLRPRHLTYPIIDIPLENVDPEEVRDFLLEILLEDEHTESLLHKIFKALGF